MKPVAQHAAATLELEEAAAWYERRVEGLGARFFEAVQQTKQAIRQNPEFGAPHRHGTRKRRVVGFPNLVVYRDEPGRILIVALAHGKRTPGYWEGRLAR